MCVGGGLHDLCLLLFIDAAHQNVASSYCGSLVVMWLDVMIYNRIYFISLIRRDVIWNFIHSTIHFIVYTHLLHHQHPFPVYEWFVLMLNINFKEGGLASWGQYLSFFNPPTTIYPPPNTSSYLVQRRINDGHHIVSIASPEMQLQVFWKGDKVVLRTPFIILMYCTEDERGPFQSSNRSNCTHFEFHLN